MLMCKACSHPERKAIDAALTAGSPERAIAGQFGLSRQSVNRHRAHISEAIAIARKERGNGHDMAQLVDDSHRRVNRIISRQMRMAGEGDGVAIKALKERRELLAFEFGSKIKLEVSKAEPSDEEADRMALEWLKARGWLCAKR